MILQITKFVKDFNRDKNNVSFKKYYDRLFFKKAVFLLLNSELFSRIAYPLLMISPSDPSLFLHLRQPIGRTTSLTSCPRVLFILNIKGGSTRTMYFIIMTSVLKIVIWITSKNICRKTMTTKNMVMETG